TRALLARVRKVIAVEADHTLLGALNETFAEEIGTGRLELVSGDIRSFDTATIPGEYSVVANIPYYITGEIIRQFLTSTHKPTSMTLLVQKEVAVRIARDKKESLLSLSVKAFGTPKYCFTVPRGAFRPAPNVDSAVLSIENIRRDAFSSPEDENVFFEVLRAGFSQKRKRLAKNLEQLYPSESIVRAFQTLGLSPNVRSEDIGEEVWRSLVHTLRI
ncbi:MAG: rRNA adenine dimethyltransferase family protein, partial [Patescibacteria group bacterium]